MFAPHLCFRRRKEPFDEYVLWSLSPNTKKTEIPDWYFPDYYIVYLKMDVNDIALFCIQFLAMSSLHSGILNFSSGASCVGYMAIVDDLQTLYAVLYLTG